MEKKKILTAKGVCKSFALNGGQTHVLSGVDMEIYEGEFIVIMGKSGSGKSTLLYALSGMDRATAGEVVYKEKDIVKMKEKELTKLRCNEFGFIFQQMHLVSNLTIFENIAVPGYLNKNVSEKETDRKTNELLEKVGISDIKEHLPSQCSGGEQQRCAVARAVINDPVIIFADEPTGALNKKSSLEVLDIMTALNKKGQCIMMVTHDSRAALRADRILYIEDGKISGELKLSPYDASDEKSRDTQVTSWLSSMGW